MNRPVNFCKKWLQKTPNALLCVLGAVLFLLVFYTLAFRTPLNQIWLAPNMDNDEVFYNRQVVSVISKGGPQGYFGYEESHADLGNYGTWGPFLIWLYALPGFIFGSSVNTMLWCNIFFTVAGMAVFARAARLSVWQQIVFLLGTVCLWRPLSAAFGGSSEPLHYGLLLLLIGATMSLKRHFSAGWFAAALAACALETICRPYALLFFVFPVVAVWPVVRRRRLCFGVAAVSFGTALFSMAKLAAPYFSDGGIDFTAVQMALQGDPMGGIWYELQDAGALLQRIWTWDILPTLQGDPQYVGTACVMFAVMFLVSIGLLIYDICRGRQIRWKVCLLVCVGIVALALLFLYDLNARHLVELCVLMLAVWMIEDAGKGVVWLPVIALALLPLNMTRSSLSTWFPEMGYQITAVEEALTERVESRDSDDPWDHTLAYSYADDVFHGYLYAVPAGMGIQFDHNTYLADPDKAILSRYAMVGHGGEAEARLLQDGWQEVISTQDLVGYERPEAAA